MKLLKISIKNNKGIALLTLLFICLQLLGTLGVPKLVADLIDTGIASGEVKQIQQIGIQMLLVALLGSFAAVASSYCSALLAARFGYQTRASFFNKFNNCR